MRITRICGIAACLVFSAASASELDAIIENCAGCHGENGVSQSSDVPSIAGIPEFVQSDALYFFRDNERPCEETKYTQGDTSRPATTMCAVVADLSDDQIDELAAHYAALKFVPAKQSFDADLAAKGKALHESDCARCHSDGGSNPDDEASILAGQQMGYLEEQFADYRTGKREQPKKMQEKIDALSVTKDDYPCCTHGQGPSSVVAC